MTAATPLHGVYHDRGAGNVERLRRAVLDAHEWYPEPEWLTRLACSAGDLLADPSQLRDRLSDSGLVEVRLDRPLSSGELIAVGRGLGRPMPETAPRLRRFVEQEVVLNLIAAYDRTADVDLQPFSGTPLTLHTERSGAPLSQQPRYLVFLCLHAPRPDAGAQTIVVPSSAVHDQLSAADHRILRHLRYATDASCPPLLSEMAGRPVFAFRDFRSQDLAWAYSGPEPASERAVNQSIEALTAAMYARDSIRGIHWRANTLVILDNTYGFHGRSAGATGPAGRQRRHLKRLRVLASDR